jgi:hypothetical protein
VNLTIKFKGETEVPFGEFSTPLDGSIVQSSIPVTGWALDDLQISSVKIYLEQNNQLIYIGDAGFIEDARPDVEQAFPGYPLNYRGGWGYIMLTNFLPNGGNGIFIFHAIANDIEGNQTTLGIHAIECDNANAFRPFGTIDTPPQGDAISGNRYINAGWVLTPKPNYIPTDGSTINVYVDGVKLGHADYNIYRGDVAGLLPGYANSGGAGAAFILDTTLFANGLHVIYWLAADSSGNLDGIGSRYFHIQNMVHFNLNQPLIQRPQAKDVANLKQAHGPIEIKKDFGINAGKKIIRENKNGIYRVKLRELERLEIHLTPGLKSPGLYQGGYLLVGKQLRLLPPGSTFDQQKGIFYWTPGLGFFGEFTFIFIRSDNRAKRIILHILP